MSLKTFVYNDTAAVTFSDGDTLQVNATQMAKAFGKMPNDYLRLDSTKAFIEAYMQENSVTVNPVTVVQGGKNQGTWMNEDIALDFAQWLSPRFKVWCNARIKELLTTGKTELSEMQQIMGGYKLLMNKCERLEVANVELTKEVAVLAPKAEVFDQVMDSTSLLNTTQVAVNHGLSAVALNKKLAEKKIQRKMSDGSWVLNADYSNQGYARLVPFPYSVRDGITKTRNNLLWTEKGRQFISQIIAQ